MQFTDLSRKKEKVRGRKEGERGKIERKERGRRGERGRKERKKEEKENIHRGNEWQEEKPTDRDPYSHGA